MRKAILMLLFPVVVMLSSAKRDNSQGNDKTFGFTVIDSIPNTSKSQLYVRANVWVAKTFVSARNVIQMSDKEEGKIIGKCVMEVPGHNGTGSVAGTDYIHYTMTIDVKDNKYRCVLSGFSHEGGVYPICGKWPDYGSLNQENIRPHVYQHRWEALKELVAANANELSNDLKASMHRGTTDF